MIIIDKRIDDCLQGEHRVTIQGEQFTLQKKGTDKDGNVVWNSKKFFNSLESMIKYVALQGMANRDTVTDLYAFNNLLNQTFQMLMHPPIGPKAQETSKIIT